MHAQRESLATTNRPTRSLLLAALLLLAVAAPALAAGGAQPMIASPQVQQEAPQIAGALAADTEGATTPQPAASQGALFSASIIYNPCYTFDDPVRGCYYTWSPQTYCCLTPAAWCPDICY